MRVDLKLLRETNRALYQKIVPHASTMVGVEDIDQDSLPSEVRYDLIGWKNDHEESAPPPSPPPPREEPEILREAMDLNETEARRKREADEKAGLARLQQYQRERGLLDSQHNGEAIRKFLEEHPQTNGIVTESTIDVAISHLGPKGSNTLQWAQPKPATPPSVPDVRRLPNGEAELPIDASEVAMRKASVPQLKDLAARRREGKQRPGWSGAKF